MNEQTTTWPDLAIGLFDKLTGGGAEITYEFVNLEVQVPNTSGTTAPPAHWKLNGALKIRTTQDVKR